MTIEAVATPTGPARVYVHPATGREAVCTANPADRPPPAAAVTPVVTLVLGHGAGGGVEAPDLVALATGLPAYGVTVVRVEQPWRVAGRRVAPAPPRLDEAWRAVLAGLAARGLLAGRLVVGGRSAGARVACRTAAGAGASGCLALAFPLHPPGRPERSRLGELLAAAVPILVLQGERDPFGKPEEFPAAVDVRVLAGAEHALVRRNRRSGAAPAGAPDIAAQLVLRTADWLGAMA